MDQTYFVLGILLGRRARDHTTNLKREPRTKTLLMPGGPAARTGPDPRQGCGRRCWLLVRSASRDCPTSKIFLGLLVMIVSEASDARAIEPFWSWNTPIA
jgi:hypothetical protein